MRMSKPRWEVHYVDAYNNECEETVEAIDAVVEDSGALVFRGLVQMAVAGFQHGTWTRFGRLPDQEKKD